MFALRCRGCVLYQVSLRSLFTLLGANFQSIAVSASRRVTSLLPVQDRVRPRVVCFLLQRPFHIGAEEPPSQARRMVRNSS